MYSWPSHNEVAGFLFEFGAIRDAPRRCFLNWDADCSGTIDSVEFRKAIRSLGLDISQADASYLVGYYGGVESAYTSVSQNEMTYDLLIEDVVNASTHFLQPQPPIPQSARPDGPFPPVLRRFIKKVRQKLFTYITGLSQCVEVDLELDLDGATRRQGRERAVLGAERVPELGQGRLWQARL